MAVFGEPMAGRYLLWLVQGFGVTLALSLAVCLAGTAVRIVVCCLRALGRPLLWVGASGTVGIVRNTPLLVQLFVWCFGVAALLPAGVMAWLNAPHRLPIGPVALRWPAYETLAGFAGLSLYAGTYIAEECRAGLNAVRPGQREAALATGLSPAQGFAHILLPQALRIAWLPMVGQYLNTIKNTSLTMTIGLAELSYASRQVETETFLAFQAFEVATLFYVAAAAAVEALGHHLARRRRPGGAEVVP